MLIPVSNARARLSELVRRSADEDVVLTNHSTPTAVMVSADRYSAMLEEIEDLKDRLSVHERTGVTVSFHDLAAEIGLDA
ncbi:type II toxin-antitoxin system Phd/YefM family antitoxin [Mycobacterium interjectum]|uniref:type II toxin-antitoxin system Phd/YefM family antitoxin n=1 Tax=Mycobacterium interjectum TaxID=33895 RepID=UPI000AAA7D5A|nr:type II toxin-antitoxin system Phd/YefM family antitoxin [Mycobacterium interjectum]